MIESHKSFSTEHVLPLEAQSVISDRLLKVLIGAVDCHSREDGNLEAIDLRNRFSIKNGGRTDSEFFNALLDYIMWRYYGDQL